MEQARSDNLRLGTIAAVALALLGVGFIVSTAPTTPPHATRTSTPSAAASPTASCVGAHAITNDCSNPYQVTELTNPATAAQDLAATTTYTGCQQVRDNATIIECVLGTTTNPTRTIALVGDSHVTQFFDGFNAYGIKHGWQFKAYTKSYCHGLGADGLFNADPGAAPDATDCRDWGQAVLETVATDPTVDAVVFSNFTQRYVDNPPHDVGRPLAAADAINAWAPLTTAGKTVVYIRDIPTNQAGVRAPECVAANMDTYDPCSTTLTESVWGGVDPMLTAADETDIPVLDFQNLFCTDRCHVLIGGLIAYIDSNHMTTVFSTSAGDVFGDALQKAITE